MSSDSRNHHVKWLRNDQGGDDSRNHLQEEKGTLVITPLMVKWLRFMVEHPTIRPYQAAQKIGEDKASVGHSFSTLNAKRSLARVFSSLYLEAERRGVFEDKDLYVPRRGGRPSLGIKWVDGQKAPGEPEAVKFVQEIFADLEQGITPTEVVKKHEKKISRESVYKMSKNYDYVRVGILKKETFDAVQRALDKAPRMAFKKFGLQWKHGRLEPDEDADAVHRIFTMRKAGKTYRQIGKKIFGLHERHDERKVCSMIHDPWYAGYHLTKEGKKERLPWITPIVSLETWKDVQGLDFTNKWLKNKFVENLKKVEELLPAMASQLQKATNFKPLTLYTYLRTLKEQGRAIRLFNGVWYKQDSWTGMINKIVEETKWRSFKVRMGWERRDSILKYLLLQPASWSEIIDRTKLPSDSVSWWLELLQKDGIVKKENSYYGKYSIPQRAIDYLRRLYGTLELLEKLPRKAQTPETAIKLARKTSREKYEKIRSHMDQWISIKDLADKTGYNCKTIYWHLRNMAGVEKIGGRGHAVLMVRLKPMGNFEAGGP